MRFLALTTRPIESRQSGYDLRVANLCAYLPGAVHLVVAPFQPVGQARPGLPLDGVFDSVEELTPLHDEASRLRRHLRTSNSHFLERSRPAAFAAARERLAEIVRERGITHVAVFGGEIAELASGLTDVTVLLDVCDSSSLTADRARAAGRGPRSWARRAQEALDVARKRRTEARFPRDFDLVTTISDPDARAVDGSRFWADGADGAVAVVPNGLDESYVRPLPEPGRRRGVVFWGNLAFGPNRDALRSFVYDVYLPQLRHRDVELCVVGADAPSWLVELAAEEPGIVLTGYVDDLPATVTRYPIMINPMRSGSGLKNKVLEAFGLGVVVVSTPLGIEAVRPAEDGTHVALARGGEEFGATVLALLDDAPRRRRLRAAAHALVREHYRWDAVGRAWAELVDPAGHAESPAGRAVPRPRPGRPGPLEVATPALQR